jgi:acyl-coenzyme A thioesterase PaaI-like protein
MGLLVLEDTPTRAVLVLPDNPAHHNHVGGPHAGALFTLGESASGAIVLSSFGHTLERATPLAVQSAIQYRRLAMGTVTATATLGTPAEEVLQILDDGGRPNFDVDIELTTQDERICATMQVTWTLRPNRPGRASVPGMPTT